MSRSVTRVDKPLNRDLKNFGCDTTKQSTSKTPLSNVGAAVRRFDLLAPTGFNVAAEVFNF
jgi:hypothetical protein